MSDLCVELQALQAKLSVSPIIRTSRNVLTFFQIKASNTRKAKLEACCEASLARLTSEMGQCSFGVIVQGLR